MRGNGAVIQCASRDKLSAEAQVRKTGLGVMKLPGDQVREKERFKAGTNDFCHVFSSNRLIYKSAPAARLLEILWKCGQVRDPNRKNHI